MEKKFNYVYLTTNLINGKCYVGDHSTNNLKDNYIGSGRPLFQRAKIKYGKENFKTQILEYFLTKQEAFNAQEKYIIQFNTLSPAGYNISPKGGCICGINGHSEESKQKIAKGNKGQKRTDDQKKNYKGFIGKHSEETKKHWSEIRKGRPSIFKGTVLTQEHKNKIGKANKGKCFRLGTHLSDETKKKISKANKGRKLSEIQKQKIREYKHSNEIKLLISKRMSGENNPMYGISPDKILCKHCNRLIDKRNYSRWHGSNCKFFIFE